MLSIPRFYPREVEGHLMTDTYFEKTLRALTRRPPFKAFAVELASGDRFTVDHPKARAQRGAIAVYINRDGQYSFFDATSVVRLTRWTNGGARRRRA